MAVFCAQQHWRIENVNHVMHETKGSHQGIYVSFGGYRNSEQMGTFVCIHTVQ